MKPKIIGGIGRHKEWYPMNTVLVRFIIITSIVFGLILGISLTLTYQTWKESKERALSAYMSH